MNTTSNQTRPIDRATAACVAARVPFIFVGDPGQGKSARLEAMLTSWGYYFEAVTGSNREAPDYLGLPVEVDGEQRYTSLDWARRLNRAAEERSPKGAGAALFMDEFNTQEDVMKAALRVLEERYAGPDKFHDDVAIMGAMNPIDSATDGIPLPPAVANRVIHLGWEFDFDSWAEGFLTSFDNAPVQDDQGDQGEEEPEPGSASRPRGPVPSLDQLLGPEDPSRRAVVRASIARFLTVMPQHRNKLPKDLDAASGAWPSIRMWTKAALAMEHLRAGDDDAERLLLVGAVGQEAAQEYLIWKDRTDLYDPMAVLDGAEVNWHDPRLDRLFALSMSLTSLVNESGDAKLWARAMLVMTQAMDAGNADIAWQGAHALLQVKPPTAKLPKESAVAFGELMDRVGLTTSAPAVTAA